MNLNRSEICLQFILDPLAGALQSGLAPLGAVMPRQLYMSKFVQEKGPLLPPFSRVLSHVFTNFQSQLVCCWVPGTRRRDPTYWKSLGGGGWSSLSLKWRPSHIPMSIATLSLVQHGPIWLETGTILWLVIEIPHELLHIIHILYYIILWH